MKPPGLAPLVLGVAGRDGRGGVDRQGVRAGQDGRVVAGFAVFVERVPERERDPEEALAADQPVPVETADPVVVTGLHVGRVPAQLRAAPQQLGLVSDRVDEPLPAGDDLQRLVTLLVELHRPDDLAWLAVQFPGLAQHRPHPLAGRVHRGAGQFPVRRTPGGAVQRGRRIGQHAPVPADDGPGRQLQLTPPLDVGKVAEGTAHRDTGAAIPFGGRVGQDRHVDPEEGRGRGAAEQRLVALVVRVGDQGHARRQQLRPRRLDIDGLAVPAAERKPVPGARVLAILQLRLGHGRAETDIPQGGGLGLVGHAALQQAQERELGDALSTLADGGVGHRPVHRQAQPPPQPLEGLLVLGGQLFAQLDKVAAGDVGRALLLAPDGLGRGEGRVIGQRWVTPHAEVVLHPALGGQPVVVPAHGVEHVLAGHPLEPGDDVSVRVGEHVPHVQ